MSAGRYTKQTNKKKIVQRFDTYGGLLQKLIIGLLVLLLCMQAAMQHDGFRRLVTSVEKNDGRLLK